MHFQKSYKMVPAKTPLIIKTLLGLIVCASMLNAITAMFFKAQYIAYLLGLSLDGFKHYYLWQLATYALPQPAQGITLSFLIELAFNLYLIWIIGSSVLDRISQLQYLIFCVFSSFFSAIVMLCVMATGYPHFIYSGPAILLYATLIAWMMLNPPDTRIFLFFVLPMRHYWPVLGLIGFNLLSNLSNNQIVNFFGYIAVVVFSYFYSVIIWGKLSPFHHFNKMERTLARVFKSKFNNRNFH